MKVMVVFLDDGPISPVLDAFREITLGIVPDNFMSMMVTTAKAACVNNIKDMALFKKGASEAIRRLETMERISMAEVAECFSESVNPRELARILDICGGEPILENLTKTIMKRI